MVLLFYALNFLPKPKPHAQKCTAEPDIPNLQISRWWTAAPPLNGAVWRLQRFGLGEASFELSAVADVVVLNQLISKPANAGAVPLTTAEIRRLQYAALCMTGTPPRGS